MLDTTLDSLDTFTSQQLIKLAGFLDQINQQLLQTVGAIQQATLDIMQQATIAAQTVLTQVQDTIVVGVRGASFVIDKTTYNAVFMGAIILLAVGLLCFVAWLWKGKPPSGWVRPLALGFMVLYVGVFTALLFPAVRVYAITMAGQGEQLEAIEPGPQIFAVTPAKIKVTTEMTLSIQGAHLNDGGEAPEVTVAGKPVTPQAVGDSMIALRLTGSAFTSLSGQQPIQVKAKDGKTASAVVEFIKPPPPPPPPQITSWRIVPHGRVAIYKEFPGVHIQCKSTSEKQSVDRTMTVDAGWVLAVDNAHQGSVTTGINGSYPNPPLGFSEANMKIDDGGDRNHVKRDISYVPEGAQRKTGIRVRGECDGSNGFLGLGWGVTGAFRSSWEADYKLVGRKETEQDGAEWKGGPCVVQGQKSCATYPADRLAGFIDGRPDLYRVWLTIKTSSGQIVEKAVEFHPNIPQERVVVENLTVWMENNQLMARGPGFVRLLPIDIIIRPLPIKDLPIKDLPFLLPGKKITIKP